MGLMRVGKRSVRQFAEQFRVGRLQVHAPRRHQSRWQNTVRAVSIFDFFEHHVAEVDIESVPEAEPDAVDVA